LTTKMLASTIQFSNNDQPQPPHPTHTPPHNKGTGSLWSKARLATKKQTPPQRHLFFQDPTGCSSPPPAAPTTPPHPPPHTRERPPPHNTGQHRLYYMVEPLPAMTSQCLRQRAPHHPNRQCGLLHPITGPGAP
jgi:hypothetical protein